MKIIFAGTPEFAKHILNTLHQYHEIVAVFCQPDRPKGRGKVLSACPVKEYALANRLSLFQPEKMGRTEQIQIQALDAQLMVVVAYGQLLPKNILNATAKGCLNIHTSLLPRWRGAAPIQRAIEAGDTQTGVCVMQMNEGLDTGNILHQLSCDIHPNDSTQTLQDKLIKLAQTAISHTLANFNQLNPIKQDKLGVNYAKKLQKQEAWINWQNTAQHIHNQIRAFNPYPIAQTLVKLEQKNNSKILKNQTLRIIKAQLLPSNNLNTIKINQTKTSLHIHITTGTLNILQVQLQGKKVMDIDVFNNGYKVLEVADTLYTK